MAAPTFLVQLSDPHLRMDEPERAAQFKAAIDAVVAMQPAPAAVLVTGDIADDGSPEASAEAARLLGALDVPVHVLPGNKDGRASLRGAFTIPGDASGDDEVRYVADAGPLRLVVCDTQRTGEIRGRLDVAWVAAQLDAEPDRPTLVAMHHPPAKVGVAPMDENGLPESDREVLAAVLERSPHVAGVVAGHLHRSITTQLGGRPVIVAPSVNFQLSGDLAADTLSVNDDPPGFLVHVLVDGRLVSHVQPVARL